MIRRRTKKLQFIHGFDAALYIRLHSEVSRIFKIHQISINSIVIKDEKIFRMNSDHDKNIVVRLRNMSVSYYDYKPYADDNLTYTPC